MKQNIHIAVTIALFLCLAGCRANPKAIIDIPYETEFVGTYLETTDVQRIGHALDTAPTRATVQWENLNTGYQYSMMVFASDAAMGTTTRSFSVLSIDQSRDAEVLNLIGTSSEKNIWHIVAEAPASRVGKAARMTLAQSPVPEASVSSGSDFNGFVVVD